MKDELQRHMMHHSPWTGPIAERASQCDRALSLIITWLSHLVMLAQSIETVGIVRAIGQSHDLSLGFLPQMVGRSAGLALDRVRVLHAAVRLARRLALALGRRHRARQPELIDRALCITVCNAEQLRFTVQQSGPSST